MTFTNWNVSDNLYDKFVHYMHTLYNYVYFLRVLNKNDLNFSLNSLY